MAKLTLKALLTADDIDKQVKTLSFENGMELLEELVEKVETGSLALDQAILSYEKGVLLVEALRTQLEGAEAKLEKLKVN
ncbi:MAG: exodeoxyribonuclease VII small subunit [Bdellovibrionota bacterium]